MPNESYFHVHDTNSWIRSGASKQKPPQKYEQADSVNRYAVVTEIIRVTISHDATLALSTHSGKKTLDNVTLDKQH